MTKVLDYWMVMRLSHDEPTKDEVLALGKTNREDFEALVEQVDMTVTKAARKEYLEKNQRRLHSAFHLHRLSVWECERQRAVAHLQKEFVEFAAYSIVDFRNGLYEDLPEAGVCLDLGEIEDEEMPGTTVLLTMVQSVYHADAGSFMLKPLGT